MLVGRRVENHLGAQAAEQSVHLLGVAHRGDEHFQVQLVAVFAAQLLLDGVGVVLVDVHDDEHRGLAAGDLAAQLGADGPAAAGDHDALAAHQLGDEAGKLHLVPAQKVFHLHVADAAGKVLAVGDHLHDVRQNFHVALGAVADGQHPAAILLVHGGDGQQDGLNFAALHQLGDVLGGAHDLHAHDVAALLFRRVVHAADDVHIGVGRLVLLVEQGAGGVARADEQGAPRQPLALPAQLDVSVHSVCQT